MQLSHFRPRRPRRPRRDAAPIVRPAIRAEVLESRVLLTVFTVTTTADSGPGSLRQAITDASRAADTDEIRFDIPGEGVHTVLPASPLPDLRGPVTLDAATQPGYAGKPLIQLDGTAAGAAADGLRLATSVIAPATVRGLAIGGFSGNGIANVPANRVGEFWVEGCYIGIDPAGQAARPNGMDGIRVSGAGATIGGTSPSQRNVISGNRGAGIRAIESTSGFIPIAAEITVQGNVIGTDAAATAAVPNGEEGILLVGATRNLNANARIGGDVAGAGNVISGNGASGVRVVSARVAIIQGNFIGTDGTGHYAIGNGSAPGAAARDGVTAEGIEYYGATWTVGGSAAAARNIISGNAGAGVALAGKQTTGFRPDVQLVGNIIGTDAGGDVDLGNGREGVVLTHFSPYVYGNLISGNGGDGFHAESTGNGFNRIEGNYIGTDATGTRALGNDGDGVEMIDGPSSGNIGEWTPQRSAPPSRIDPARRGRNIISGIGGHGVRLAGQKPTPSFSVLNNYIGTDLTGSVPLGNGKSGIYIVGGGFQIGRVGWTSTRHEDGTVTTETVDVGNLISANRGDGITVVGSGASGFWPHISTNRIGTDATGNGPGLGNGGNGITLIDTVGAWVAGQDSGELRSWTNTIAYNAGAGVAVTTSAAALPPPAGRQNRIVGNRIFSNGGPEIDLGADGVTPNDPGDADDGPNGLVNYPVITDVGAAPAGSPQPRSTVRFTLNAEPLKKYALDFYSAHTPDPSGHGGAERFLGYTEVTTDAAGYASGVAFVQGVPAGEYVSATATDSQWSTSEFSAAVQATPAEVMGRFVAYGHGRRDGNEQIPGTPADPVVAPDKYPLAGPGELTTVANITSYSRGINGIVVDMANVPDGANPTADDFEFRSGAGVVGYDWADTPAPSSVTLRRGAGVAGSDRVTLAWDDAPAVKNGWLQVTVKATPNTGLSRPDVFYFGNLVGSAGADAAPLKVDNADLASTRARLGRPPTGGDRAYDFDQDGVINVRDLAIARANLGRTLSPLTAAPQAVPPAAAASVFLEASQRSPAIRRRRYDGR